MHCHAIKMSLVAPPELILRPKEKAKLKVALGKIILMKLQTDN